MIKMDFQLIFLTLKRFMNKVSNRTPVVSVAGRWTDTYIQRIDYIRSYSQNNQSNRI